MYKLIVKQAPIFTHDETQAALLARLRAKQYRYRWNYDAKCSGLPLMQSDLTDDHYIVYMLFDSEEEAALFKLTHL